MDPVLPWGVVWTLLNPLLPIREEDRDFHVANLQICVLVESLEGDFKEYRNCLFVDCVLSMVIKPHFDHFVRGQSHSHCNRSSDFVDLFNTCFWYFTNTLVHVRQSGIRCQKWRLNSKLCNLDLSFDWLTIHERNLTLVGFLKLNTSIEVLVVMLASIVVLALNVVQSKINVSWNLS